VHDYLFPIEVVRFAFVLGVVVSMLLYERKHLTTGSIVVPGYVAVFLLLSSVIVATMLNAAVSYLVVNKVLSRRFLLYGRTKFTVLALISISLQTLMLKVSPTGPWLWEADVPLFVGVGYVVPALIAHDMARQGVGKTARSVLLASAIVGLPILGAVALQLPEVTALGAFRPISRTHLEADWIPLAILLSAAASWGVARNHGLRSGGFVGAALVAVFAVNPWQVAFLVGVAILTHQIVTRVLMKRLILFGRRKFAAMLMLSSTLVWMAVWTGERFFPVPLQEHLGVTSLALTPLFLPGLLANDMQRSSISRVLTGVTLASTFVLSVTWTIETAVTRQAQPVLHTVMAVVTAAAIFGPQLRAAAEVALAQIVSLHAAVWARVQPELDAVVVAPVALAVATLPSPVDHPAASHTPRPLGHRGPLASPTDPTAWLAGRRQAQTLSERPPKHLAGPTGYRPRHLAAPSVHRFHTDEARSARAS
jgi:poly-gamma-glutamate biosynthesis protein PgsC/CapC